MSDGRFAPIALAATARRTPERLAIRWRGTGWSYGWLDRATDAVTAGLQELGVRRGDRVAVLLPKRPEAIAALLGAQRAGAMSVAVDAQAPPAHAAEVIAHVQASAVVSSAARLAELPDAPRAILVDEVGGSAVPSPGGSLRFADLVASTAQPRPVPLRPDDRAMIALTSGSTGRPKGVVIDHAALDAAMQGVADRFGVGAHDVLAVVSPLQFKQALYGMLPAIAVGATSVLVPMEAGVRPGDVAALIRDEGISVWKSMTHALRPLSTSDLEAGSLPSLRLVSAGGGAWPMREIRAFQRIAPNAEIRLSYGSTEASTSITHVVGPGDPDDAVPPIGHPNPGVRVLLLAEEGRPAPDGEIGELYVSGPQLLREYWRDPEATAAVLGGHPTGQGEPDERWYRTGDLMRRRPDGALEFVGRADSMIKSRGYRIELGAVESALASHASVRDAMAVAVPHPDWGSAVVAVVECQPAAAIDEGTLRSHLAERLPAYMHPVRYLLGVELPRTPNGKPDRARTAALVASGSFEEAVAGA